MVLCKERVQIPLCVKYQGAPWKAWQEPTTVSSKSAPPPGRGVARGSRTGGGTYAGQEGTMSSARPIVVAHRGLAGHAPENTLPAFAAALELRLGLEIDLCATADG